MAPSLFVVVWTINFHLLLHYLAVTGSTVYCNENGILSTSTRSIIHVAIVACGRGRAEEALTSMRSILINTRESERLYFHIVHKEDDHNDEVFAKVLGNWQLGRNSFRFALYTANLPEAYSNLFAPCACQRLFFHNLLPTSVPRIIYLDSDTLLLDDISHLWDEFTVAQLSNQSATILAAMGAEHEAKAKIAHYRDEAKHPYYSLQGVNGLNSGVIVLDLELLRQHSWNEQLEFFRQTYDLVFYDQDLLNLYFHKFPEQLYLFQSCRWNYRPDYCYFKTHCPDGMGSDVTGDPVAEQSLISLLHGNRGVFHKQTKDEWSVMAFALIYQAFRVDLNSSTTPQLGSCVNVYLQLEQIISTWMTSVTRQDMTNNCQAIALPLIFSTFLKNCNGIQQAIGNTSTRDQEL